MGQLNNKILGDSSGRVGGIVFRERGDKVYIAKRPRRRTNQIVSDLAKAIRDKFTLTVAVCKGINAAPLLKGAWAADPSRERSKFNIMFRTNYKSIGTIDSPGTPVLVPQTGFKLTNPVITLTPTGFTVAADAPGASSGIDPSTEKFIAGVGVVVLTVPTNLDQPKFKVIPVRTGMQSTDEDTPVSLRLDLVGSELSDYELYTTKQVALTLVTMTQGGVRMNNSVTFTNK